MSKYNGKDNKDNLWALNNIPGYEIEKYIFCYEDYIEKLQFQLLGYELWDGAPYGRGIYTEDVLKDWGNLAKEVSEKYKPYLNRSGLTKEILDTIINVSDTKDVKIRNIYRFVNSYFKWDKDYYIFSEKSIGELLESRQGNSAEINLLLCLLLNEAGIKAYPVLISTKFSWQSHSELSIIRAVQSYYYCD